MKYINNFPFSYSRYHTDEKKILKPYPKYLTWNLTRFSSKLSAAFKLFGWRKKQQRHSSIDCLWFIIIANTCLQVSFGYLCYYNISVQLDKYNIQFNFGKQLIFFIMWISHILVFIAVSSLFLLSLTSVSVDLVVKMIQTVKYSTK